MLRECASHEGMGLCEGDSIGKRSKEKGREGKIQKVKV
jgi:hypothetical protein